MGKIHLTCVLHKYDHFFIRVQYHAEHAVRVPVCCSDNSSLMVWLVCIQMLAGCLVWLHGSWRRLEPSKGQFLGCLVEGVQGMKEAKERKKGKAARIEKEAKRRSGVTGSHPTDT